MQARLRQRLARIFAQSGVNRGKKRSQVENYVSRLSP